MDPLRLRVLKALCAQIKTVKPANGDTFDLSDFTDEAGRTQERVFRGRTGFGDSDPETMVSILDHPNAIGQILDTQDTGQSVKDWPLLIQGFTPDDLSHPTDPAHFLVAEVQRALAKAKRMGRFKILGIPQIDNMTIGHPVVRPPDDEISSFAHFLLPLTISLFEDSENPFS